MINMCIFVYDRWKTLHRQMATWRMRQRSWDPRHTQGPTLLPIQPLHLPPQALLADLEQLAHQGEELSSKGYELLFTQIWDSLCVTADVIFISYFLRLLVFHWNGRIISKTKILNVQHTFWHTLPLCCHCTTKVVKLCLEWQCNSRCISKIVISSIQVHTQGQEVFYRN